MNNEPGTPCLMVFDQDRIEGSSPQSNEEFICPSLSSGTELAYVIFPSNKDFLFPGLMEGVGYLEVRENSTILTLTNRSRIQHVFDFDMNVVDIRSTHKFQAKYIEKFRAGRLKEPWDEKSYAARLKEQFRWWGGENWVATPTMTHF
jgi:hypothetical protein